MKRLRGIAFLAPVVALVGFGIAVENAGCASMAGRCFTDAEKGEPTSPCSASVASFCKCSENKVYACVDKREVAIGIACTGDVEHDEHATLESAVGPGAAGAGVRIVGVPKGKMDVHYPASSTRTKVSFPALDESGRLTTAFGPGAFNTTSRNIYRNTQTLPLFASAFGTARDGCGILKSDGTLLCWTSVYQGKPGSGAFALGKGARGKRVTDLMLDEACWTDGREGRCEIQPSQDAATIESRNAAFAMTGVRKFLSHDSDERMDILDRDGVLRSCAMSQPSGKFACDAVSDAAGHHLIEVTASCGVDEQKRIVCWPGNASSTPPTGATKFGSSETGILCYIDGADGDQLHCLDMKEGGVSTNAWATAPSGILDFNASAQGSLGQQIIAIGKQGEAYSYAYGEARTENERHVVTTFPLPESTCLFPRDADGTTTCGTLEIANAAERTKFDASCVERGGKVDTRACSERVSEPLRWRRQARTPAEARALTPTSPLHSYYVFGPLTDSAEERCKIGEYAGTETDPAASCFP